MVSSDAAFKRAARRLSAKADDGYVAADLARCALDLGREEEALPLVARAAARLKASAVLHQWTGVLARAVGDSELAFAHFAVAAKIAPTDVRIAQGCALSALEAGWPATALFERALALAPLDETGLLGRAAARVADGEAGRAAAEIDSVLAVNPGWLGGHHRSAQLHRIAGAPDHAFASLQRALREAPRDPALWQTLLTLQLQAGAFVAARADAARARMAVGHNAAIDLAEATARSELGDVSGADRLFDGLSEALPSLAAVRHLLRTGRHDAATRLAEGGLDSPGAAALWPYIALGWRLTGDRRLGWLGESEMIGEVSLDLDLATTAARLRTLHERSVLFVEQSVRGGRQTDGPLFARADPVIAALRTACAEAVRRHVAALPPPRPGHPTLSVRRDRPIRFAGSWSVRLQGRGYHVSHVHPHGWLSSALFIAVPPADTTGSGWLDLGGSPPDLGLDLAPLHSVRPEPGKLVLFPSTLWHATRPFAAGERLTVAFDVARPIGPC